MRVDFDFSGGRIVLEGDGPELLDVIKAAKEIAPHIQEIKWNTGGKAPSSTKHENGLASQEQSEDRGQLSGKTLRQFVESLRLENLSEKLTAIAYFMRHSHNVSVFSPKEMGQWFTMCRFQKPTQMPVAFSDARRAHGYIENIGRGEWRITTNGENLIVSKLNEQNE